MVDVSEAKDYYVALFGGLGSVLPVCAWLFIRRMAIGGNLKTQNEVLLAKARAALDERYSQLLKDMRDDIERLRKGRAEDWNMHAEALAECRRENVDSRAALAKMEGTISDQDDVIRELRQRIMRLEEPRV